MYRTVEGEDCKPCFEGCLTCSGPLQTDCMTCASPLVKNTALGEPGACVKGCSSSHQYPDSDGVCQECDATCLTCKGPGIYSCLTCAAGQQKHPPSVDKLGLCSSCELHQFLDTAGTGYCEECSYACSTCYGSLFQNCMSCNYTEFRTLIVTNPSVYPPEKECQCINYYVQEADPVDALITICNPCHYSCMKCSTSETENACTECEEAKGRILDADANTCVCNEIGFYTIADQLQCGICYPTCKKCTSDSRYACLECNGEIDVEPDGSCGCPTGTYLTSEYLCVKPEECGGDLVGIVSEANAENTGNICGERPCPIPFFYNYTTMECKEKCFTGCLTCLNANESSCQTCIDTYYWTYFGNTGTCTSNCEKPLFYVPKSINLKERNTCEDRCPDGFGPDQNSEQKCSKCHYLCKTCYKANDEFACKSCESPLSLSQSYGKQEFRNQTMSKVTCQKCSAGQFLAVTPRINDSSVQAATEQCLTTCLNGQYEDALNRECVNCKDVNCITCSESYDYCEKCLTDYDLIEGSCQPEANQESCITSGKYIKGAALECVDECGSGYYQNTLTHICEKCDPSCDTCSGGEDPNKCKTCAGNRIYYATKHTCVYQCPAGTYQSKTATGEATCTECITGCGACTGPAISECTQCADSYYMITDDDGKLSDCITDCSSYNSNTYGDKSTQTCQPCNSKCKTCISEFATGCLSCYDDDIFSRPSATSAGGTCKVKSDQKSELQEKSASDIASSTADELQQQATEIVAAFTQTISTTSTTTTTDSTSTDATDSSSTDSTATKEIATTQTKEEIEAEKAKKKELLSAVITTAKEMSAKEDLTTDEAKALIEAVKYSVKPEVSVTMVTASGEKVESTAIADDDSEEVARKFDKDESIAVCDTLTNVVDKIDVTADEEVTQNIFEAASDVLKQTATLQQDKKVAKGTATSIDDSTDETTQEQIKEDMEVVKKVVEFCDNLSNQIKKNLAPGNSMKFNTTEMKLEVAKFSTGDKNSLKDSLISTLSVQETTTTPSAYTDSNATTNETTTTTDDSDPTRQINHPEIVIKDGLVDHLSDVLDKLKEEGKDVSSLTVKKASYDLDINTLSKNTSNETDATTSDFTRASHIQQFGFELDDNTTVNISELADDAQFEIQFDYISDEDSSFSCVYWNVQKQQYDSTGVELDQETKTCKSKHLTDFIVQKVKKNNKHVFNFGILAVVIPIALCLILFVIWFLRNRKHSVSSFETIGNEEIDFTTLSPLVSIWKAKTVSEALNRITHFACYLISIMMFLVLFFRDSVDIDNNFDGLLIAGLVFGLSFAIILKYFLGTIKTQTQSHPWVYFVVSIAYFTACSGITIWRMHQLIKEEAWNWFHATYLVLIFDFVILDTLIIVALRMGLWKKLSKIQSFLSNGGFLAIPRCEQMKVKGSPILDIERGTSRHSSPQISNDVIVVDNIVEGEQFGSRPSSKSGVLNNKS